MTITDLPAADYATAMTAPLTAAATTAAALGIRPSYLQVSRSEYHDLVDNRPWQVSVQVDDIADADRLAAHYELPGDNDTTRSYTRQGTAVFDGIGDVGVCVYTGRPKSPFPTGYAPSEVAA